jgi:DNA-binding LytR/AlgR family response regulator
MIPKGNNNEPQYLRVVHSRNQLLEQKEENNYKKRFLVKSGETLVPVAVNEVAYFCAYDKWTYLVHKSGKRYLIDEKLKTLEERIDPLMFFRLNRRFFVNIESIRCLCPYLKGQVTVKVTPDAKESIVISRKKTSLLKKWITGDSFLETNP